VFLWVLIMEKKKCSRCGSLQNKSEFYKCKERKDGLTSACKFCLRSDVLKLDDLKIGMELMGTVRNVIDFGVFVDCGVKDDGLVHISQLSDKRVEKVKDIVDIGKIIPVKIIGIDDQGRINLSLKEAEFVLLVNVTAKTFE